MSRQTETTGPQGHGPAGAGGRMAAEERRRQIVGVAMRVFSERGFRGTTTREIAQAAGVSEAIIFRHFSTKEELYKAIIDFKGCGGSGAESARSLSESVRCSVAEAVARKDDRAFFEGLALAMMAHHERDPRFLPLLLYSALEGHELAQMFWDRNVRQMYEFLGSYIRDRQRDGAFRAVDPLVVVRAFTGSVIHHSLNNTLWDTSRTLLDISNERAAREFTGILLQGISRTGETKPHRAAGTMRGESRRRAAAKAAPRRGKKKKSL